MSILHFSALSDEGLAQAESETTPPSKLTDRNIAIGLFALTLIIYCLTLCRTIYTGDDGDFITAMVTTGIPHPTGYPLFLLMGKLFLLLPFGDMPFRINLMTAVFGAASVGMLYRLLVLLTPHRFLAATGALLYAFSPTLWQQSLSCEVYSLTCLFLTTLLYLLRYWWERPHDNRLLCLIAFIYGLSLTNHMSMGLFLPGFLVVVYLKRRTLFREGKLFGALVVAFVLPLSLYLYLLLAARFSDSPMKWGNPTTLPTLFAHMTGRQYKFYMFSHPEIVLPSAQLYIGYLAKQFGWFLPFALIGLVAWLRSPERRSTRAFLGLLLYIYVAILFYGFNYLIFDIHVYYLPSYLVAITLITVGLSETLLWLFARTKQPLEKQQHYLRLLIPIFLTIPIVQMSLHYAETDKSGNYLEADFAVNTLLCAPKNAVIIERRDDIFPLWYRQFVLKERPDITIISPDAFPNVFSETNPWYRLHLRPHLPEIDELKPVYLANKKVNAEASLLELIRLVMKKGRPVLIVLWANTEANDPRVKALVPEKTDVTIYENLLGRDFIRAPWGIGERLYLPGTEPSRETLYNETAPFWKKFSRRGLYTGWAQADPLQEHLIRRYAASGVAFAELAELQKQYDVAANEYTNALRLYNLPAAEQGLARCQAALGKPNP